MWQIPKKPHECVLWLKVLCALWKLYFPLLSGPTARLPFLALLEVGCGHTIKLQPTEGDQSDGTTSRPACQDVSYVSLHALSPSMCPEWKQPSQQTWKLWHEDMMLILPVLFYKYRLCRNQIILPESQWSHLSSVIHTQEINSCVWTITHLGTHLLW